jgi:hypothetical protein
LTTFPAIRTDPGRCAQAPAGACRQAFSLDFASTPEILIEVEATAYIPLSR